MCPVWNNPIGDNCGFVILKKVALTAEALKVMIMMHKIGLMGVLNALVANL